MRYRVTCLTPLLVGDGRKLSPIDYMVWKDHVNVLDQWRIFRLLAKGPRLEGYLTQLKNAEKLDFASWGGFAQNFAGRRIPFENAGLFGLLESRGGRQPAHSHLRRRRLRARICRPRPSRARCAPAWFSPTGATACCRKWRAACKGERCRGGRRRRGRAGAGRGRRESHALCERRRFGAGAPTRNFKVYLLRTSTLQPRGGGFTLGWKQSPRGAVDGAPSGREHSDVRRNGRARARRSKACGTKRRSSCSPKCGARCAGRKASAARGFSKRPTCTPQGLLALQRQYASWAGHGAARQEPGRVGAAAGGGPRKGRVPALAGMGRRPHREERVARHHQRRLPADSAAIRDLQSRPGHAICRSPRRAASCSWTIVRRRCRGGWN